MIVLTVIRWLALLLIHNCVGVSSKFIISRIVVCSKDNSTKLFLNVTTENNKQHINLDMTLNRPLDETVGMTVDLKTTLNGKTYLPLVAIHEKDFCKACNAFLGEMWYDIQRAAQIIPGACPIMAKRYYLHHHLLDLDRMTLQAIPFGKLRSIIHGIDNTSKNKNSLFCIQTDVEHIGN